MKNKYYDLKNLKGNLLGGIVAGVIEFKNSVYVKHLDGLYSSDLHLNFSPSVITAMKMGKLY